MWIVREPGPLRLASRGLALFLISGYLLAGPLLHQAFGLPVPRVFLRWQMFVGKAIDICEVEYTERGPGGARSPIDVRETLRRPGQPAKARPLRIVEPRLDWLSRRLCARLAAKRHRPVDLRLRARCGSRGRWVAARRGAVNVCRR